MAKTSRLQKKYFVYIVKCSDGTYYPGKTTDLSRRLLEHNGVLKNGAKYTRPRRPVALVFYEQNLTNSSASRREQEIKQMSRSQKEALITGRILPPLK